MDQERLPFFVYGTLLPGQPNAYLWGDSVIETVEAKIAGCCLYDMGSYPMLVEAGFDSVVGMVQTVAVANYEAVMERLDYLEGFNPAEPDELGYKRVVREVQVANGRLLQAWVYMGHSRAVAGCKPIPDGDWAAYATKTFQDIERWWREATSGHGLSE